MKLADIASELDVSEIVLEQIIKSSKDVPFSYKLTFFGDIIIEDNQKETVKRFYHDYQNASVEASKTKEIEAAEQREREQRIEMEYAHVIVTTGDLKQDYDVLGPVFFQVNNRTQGFSGKSKLSMLENEYKEIAESNREKSGIGLMSALFLPVGEFGPGDNRFSTAFYIAVEELKKQAARMGGDAIVAMHQDIDIDSNGFQYFYLQMYGTAVRLRKDKQ